MTRVVSIGLLSLLVGCGSSSSDAGADVAKVDAAGEDASAPSDAIDPDLDATAHDASVTTDASDAVEVAVDAPAPKPAVLPWVCKKAPTIATPSDECTAAGWCAFGPSPTVRDLHAVHVSGPTDVWAGGRDGGFLHGNGTSWSRTSLDPSFAVQAIARHPTDGLWAIDARCNVARLYGSTWVSTGSKCTGSSHALWIGAADDAWTVGGFGAASHWNGTAWTSAKISPGYSYFAVHGLSKTDVWAVGEQGMVVRWNGTAWSKLPAPSAPDAMYPTLRAVFGVASDQVWVGGRSKSVSRWNGTAWETHALPAAAGYVGAIWGMAANDVWFAEGDEDVSLHEANVYHWDGASITKVATLPVSGIASLHGDSTSNVWAVGPAGALARWNGTTWTLVRKGLAADIGAFWGSASNDVWAAANDAKGGVMLRFDGTTWSEHTHFDHPSSAVWGIGPDDVWAGGSSETIDHWDGKAWTSFTAPGGVSRMWGAATDDVWAIRSAPATALLHWDGVAWSNVPIGSGSEHFEGISGSSSNDVWAVTTKRELWHWNGSLWSLASKPTDSFEHGYDVFALGPTDVWVADFGFARWNGSVWTAHKPPIVGGVVPGRIWAFSPNDVWAGAGGGDLVDRWDGSAATSTKLGLGTRPVALWGCTPDELWMGGARGTLLRRKL